MNSSRAGAIREHGVNLSPRLAPLYIRDELYKKRHKWRRLDEATRSAEEAANFELATALMLGPVSPRRLRNAVLHRSSAEAMDPRQLTPRVTRDDARSPISPGAPLSPGAQLSPGAPISPSAPPSYDEATTSSESEDVTYDAEAYSWTYETKQERKKETAPVHLKAVEPPVAVDDAVAAATRRIEALERRVAAMRAPCVSDDEASVAPTYAGEQGRESQHAEEVRRAERPCCSSRVSLWADASRRALERRKVYSRERAAIRAEEAAIELRELARRRRALSAPGPFENLMRREAQMADRKQQRELQRREAERCQIAAAKFKAKPPPTPPPPPPADPAQIDKTRATSHLARADVEAPRVANLATVAARAKQRPATLRTKRTSTSPAIYKRASSQRKAATTKARLTAARMRWDAFVHFQRRRSQEPTTVPYNSISARDGISSRTGLPHPPPA